MVQLCCGDPESEAAFDTHPRTRGIPNLEEVKIQRKSQEQEQKPVNTESTKTDEFTHVSASATTGRAQTEASMDNFNSAIDLTELSRAASDSNEPKKAEKDADDMTDYKWDATVDSDEEVQEFIDDRNEIEEKN